MMPCPHARLLRLLLERARDARLVEAGREDWASATFTGMRHRLSLALPAAALPWLRDALRPDGLAIPGHLVADIAIVGEERHGADLLVRVDALTLERR